MKGTCIKNVMVYDGSGSKPFCSDLLIKKEKISLIGDIKDTDNFNIVDGENFALAPGFINTHSHSDLEVFRKPEMDCAIRQGITTEVIGQDGSSVAPVYDEIVGELADNMAPLAGVIDKPYWWRTYGEYLNEIKKSNSAVRIEGLAGHGTIRMCIMGNDNRKPTSEELERIKALTAKCMEEGAKGISFGLIYPPGSYADTDELIEICKVVKEYDGILMVHMRNEQDKLLESLDEMGRITKETKVRMHISHLKALGYRNWGKLGDALQKIERMREEGLEITFDHYPYTATCTGLKVIVPMWAYEGGEQAFQKRLNNELEYKTIAKEVSENIEARGGADKILIASVATEKNSWMSGNNLEYISKKMGIESEHMALRILKMEGPSVVAIYFSISDEDVATAMKSPIQNICTDGIVGAHPHPRTYGSFPRVLGHYSRKLGYMNIEEAIRKMTMEPARRLRLWDRGLIREGLTADLVLFDPKTIKDMNSYMEPKIYPVGIKAVWVKGELKYSERLG